jgi:DNA repair exonuclease SbcCD ATPase subunit
VLEELCGQTSLQNVMLVTTMWDGHGPQSMMERREKDLKEQSWKAMIDQGSTVVRYERTSGSAWSILDPFIRSANLRLSNLAQQEIIGLRRRARKTRAVQELYSALEDLVKTWQEIREEIREETREEATVDGQGDKSTLINRLRDEEKINRKRLAVKVSELRASNLPVGKHLFPLLRVPAIA